MKNGKSKVDKITIEMLKRECRSAHAVIGRLEWMLSNLLDVDTPLTPTGHEMVAVDPPTSPIVDTDKNKAPATDKPQTPKKDIAAIYPFAYQSKRPTFSQMEMWGAIDSITSAKSGKAGENAGNNNPTGNNTSRSKSALATTPANTTKRKRGCPTITRKEAMENYKRIVGERVILNLSDVNMIFGYNESTSGCFIQNAIRRGDLMTIQYGKARKFLAKEVKTFLKEWYAQTEPTTSKSVSGK